MYRLRPDGVIEFDTAEELYEYQLYRKRLVNTY